MGNTSSAVPEAKNCSECILAFHVHVENPCSKTLCLKCYWNHYRHCLRCQQHQHTDVSQKETISLFTHLKKELDDLNLSKKVIEANCDSATERYRREVINSHEKERDLREAQRLKEEQQKQILSLQDKLNGFARQTGLLNTKIEQANSACNRLTRENASLKEQLARDKLKGDQLQRELNQAKSKLVELNPEKSPIAAQLRKKTEQCVQLNQELAECRKLLKDKDTLIARLNKELENIDQLHLTSGHLEMENQQLKARVQLLEANKTFQSSEHHLCTSKRYFIEMSVDDVPMGRVVIETYPECAPNICQLFHKLMNGIDAIYLLNRITKVKSSSFIVIPEAKTKNNDPLPLCAADFNDLQVKRGAVGMRVQSFAADDVHLVGSQLSITLGSQRDPLFSYVFGHVVEGLTVCDAISRLDPSQRRIIVSDCGQIDG